MQLNYLKKFLNIFTIIGLLALVGCSEQEDLILSEETELTAFARTTISANSVITIQAEDYDEQSGVQTENTTDSGGGQNVGWINTGDYLEYDLNVSSSGSYKFEFRVASKNNNSKFDFYQDNTKLSNVNKAVTGAWQTWKTTSKTVNLSAGNSTLKILATGGGWNINWIKITPVDVEEDNNEVESSNDEESNTNGVFDFGGVFDIETSDNCGSDTGTDTKDYVTISNNTSRTQDGLTFFENSNGNYILQSCDQKGTRTEWKQSSTFSLSDNRKMSYNAKFYDYPNAGVTIAQVHNRGGAGRPLLRVEIIDGEIEFIIVDTWEKGEGSSHKVAGPDYTENTYLDLSFEIGDDKIIAKVTTTNGAKTVTYTKNNTNDDYNINNKWYENGVNNSSNGIDLDEGFYFKAGVYNDSGNGSDNPKGEFTSFIYEE